MKRVFLKFEVYLYNKVLLPWDFNYLISSFIYKNFLIDIPDIHNSTRPKGFTFGLQFKKMKATKNGIRLEASELMLIISTSDNRIADALLNFNKNKIYKIENMHFKIIESREDNSLINHNILHLRTNTPICLNKRIPLPENKFKEYFLSPKDNDFIDVFKKSIISKNNFKECELEIDVIEETVKSKSIKIKNNYVKAFNFDFFIKISDLETLNKNFYSGFGIKNSQGFGLVEIINF